MIALLDCNSFYASCERVFRPDLANKPVLVLSSNDGCVIAMTEDLKKLGVKIGLPYFKYKKLLKNIKPTIFSSNFQLYGDISARVVDCLRSHLETVNVYSIDESFFNIPIAKQVCVHNFSKHIRYEVTRWTGVPVCIGVGASCTLAKVANRLAKKKLAGTDGVCVINDEYERTKALEMLAVEDVWGIGRQSALWLKEHGVKSALDFCNLASVFVRHTMGQPGVVIQSELNGISLVIPNKKETKRQSIIHTRRFVKRISSKKQIAGIARMFAVRVAERARSYGLRANAMNFFLCTDKHAHSKQHVESRTGVFGRPTSDSWQIMAKAQSMAREIYRPGFEYVRAGVTLIDLASQEQGELNLGDNCEQRYDLLNQIDYLNQRYGSNTVRFGSGKWRAQQSLLSPCYTTNINDICQVA